MAGRKIKRFHKDVFFPSWYNSSLKKFMEELYSGKSIVFSLHAVENVLVYTAEFGRKLGQHILKSARKDALNTAEIFEFYAVNGEIKKAVFRFDLENFPVDLVMVVAQDATIITIFVTNKGDNHESMDVNLYEKKE